MLPFNCWFCIFFLQILKPVIYELALVARETHPAEQLGLFEICYVSPIILSIHCGAPLSVCFQVNQPYFFIVIVIYNNLLRTDHLNFNPPKLFNFHFLPKQNLSVAVSVKNRTMLFNILSVLHSSLLLHQKHECVVEGSKCILNICVLIFEADGNHFFVKHRIQSININDWFISQLNLYHQ